MPSSPTGQASQGDWRRPANPKLKAIGEPIGRVNPLLTPNPARPFTQYDWRRPADLPKLKAVGEPVGRVNPLLTPNPARPFTQALWENPARSQTAKVDDLVNIPKAAIVVQPPFSQSDWPLAVAARRNIIDTSVGPPVQPAQPFNQNLWEGAKPLPKAIGEAASGIAPLLTPNPSQPFNQSDWLRAPFARKLTDTSIEPSLALYYPGTPFSQDDWPLPHGYVWSDRGFAFGFNPNLPPPPPPPPSKDIHFKYFLADVGTLMGR
jgi:hypothetical protein